MVYGNTCIVCPTTQLRLTPNDDDHLSSRVIHLECYNLVCFSDIPCPEGLQIEGVAMKDLLSELQEVTDWFYFGVCLGVHEWKLKAIRRDYEDTEECKREMLFIWMNKEVATWVKVIRALAEIEMERLALAIASKYGTLYAHKMLHACMHLNSYMHIPLNLIQRLHMQFVSLKVWLFRPHCKKHWTTWNVM